VGSEFGADRLLLKRLGIRGASSPLPLMYLHGEHLDSITFYKEKINVSGSEDKNQRLTILVEFS
jgi:hypothetical protein